MKRQLPLILVFIFGVFMIFQYFVPHESSEWVFEFLLDWVYIIGIFALALGIWSLVRVSWDKIHKRKENWPYAIVTLFGLAAMIFFGFDYGRHFFSAEGLENFMFRHFFDYIMIPIQATMFSLLATLLLMAALIVMLRFNPYLGSFVAEYMEKTASWLLNVPNLAAKRGIIIGVGLGIVATALKVILGIERNYLGKD